MSDRREIPTADALRDALMQDLARQTDHPCIRKLVVDWNEPYTRDGVTMICGGGRREVWTPEFLIGVLANREGQIANECIDPFNDGVWPAAWHEVLWEICALRVRNPGLPIEHLIDGANGSGKTSLAAAVIQWAMVKAPPRDRLFWAYAMDEPNSETVQQAALYYWMPNGYKTFSGAVKGSQKTKLRYNTSGGFTDNRFGLDNGSRMECRFWSKAIESLEGPRPWCVWSDEEIPILWMDGIRRRLLTYAEGTKKHIPQWEALLMKRIVDPEMQFPRELLWQLMQGVHLITFTPKSGYTETVAAFVEGGKVMREIDATLLAKTNKKTGEAEGFERVPKIIHSADEQRSATFLHAWDNPWGGNWEGMQKEALKKSRSEILWWCYGVAEKIGDSPFPNFNVQAHVRPVSWISGLKGTWYHIVDPVASGGRAWFQIWAIVCGEVRGHLQPGDIFVAWEWPKEDWHVRDEGFMGKWAEPGGKAGQGVRGPAQRSLGWGYRRQKEEVGAVETKLYTIQYPDGVDVRRSARTNGEPRIHIPDGNRIMDSRAANTEKENESESKTLIDWMAEDTSPELKDGLDFIPAGRDSGAATGQTRVHPGEQMINNLLYFDKELAELDPKTGWLVVPPALGRGPRLYISEGCTNLISALRHYPGIFTGADSAFKDPVDCLRYLVIANPEWVDPTIPRIRGGGAF